MNTITFQHKNINAGQEITLETPLSEEEAQTQLAEIFEEEHYREGRVKRDMVVVDIGANMGLTCHYFAPYARKIYALEPSSRLFEALVKNTQSLSQVETFNLGIAAHQGQDLLVSNDKGDVPQSFWGNGQIKELVSFVPLDMFFEENKIDKVDLLKIDTEGAEYIIFPSLGFEKVASKIDYIIGEAHYIDKQFVPDFIPLILADYGFETKFLPITNVYLTLDFDRAEGGIKKYTVNKQTLFFAQRLK